MPKLPKARAEAVSNSESSSFEPLPESIYTVKLNNVTVKEGDKGPYWSWELEVVEGEFKTRRQWVNTSLSEAADWKLKEVFDAFGYTADSDTDEMVGERCKIAVTQRVIEKGARAGETGNNVDRCIPISDDDTDAESDEDDETF